MKVKIINKSKNPLPEYKTEGSSGIDLRANIIQEENGVWSASEIILEPGERILVHTGLFMSIEQGFEGQIRPRSGLALKHGITVLNTPGTIDSDYRGEIGVILLNTTLDEEYIIRHGERIAQLVFIKSERAELIEAKELDETERGSGGFGSTGKK